jgi:hypothetical protein
VVRSFLERDIASTMAHAWYKGGEERRWYKGGDEAVPTSDSCIRMSCCSTLTAAVTLLPARKVSSALYACRGANGS